MKRLAKAISDMNYCSRRNAEKHILAGNVKVNGDPVTEIVTFVSSNDIIEVEGVKLFEQKPRLWLYYKPCGLITTHHDPQGRPTVFDHINIKDTGKIISIGRLDIASEGLLLLTNSGELARKFELPSTGYARVYKVKAYGNFSERKLRELERGVTIDGIHYGECKIKFLKTNNTNHWFEVTIYEGKNREIRRLFEYIGLQVNRLIRIAYHHYHLGDLKPGDIIECKIETKL